MPFTSNMLKHDIPKTIKEWEFTKARDPKSDFMMRAFDFYMNNSTIMVINTSFDRLVEFLRNKKSNMASLPYENGRDSVFDFKGCSDYFTPDPTIEGVAYDYTDIRRYIKSTKRIFWGDKLPLVVEYRKNWCMLISPMLSRE